MKNEHYKTSFLCTSFSHNLCPCHKICQSITKFYGIFNYALQIVKIFSFMLFTLKHLILFGTGLSHGCN